MIRNIGGQLQEHFYFYDPIKLAVTLALRSSTAMWRMSLRRGQGIGGTQISVEEISGDWLWILMVE